MPRNRPRPPVAPALRRAYACLRTVQGHQHWWPAQTPFEVCVGAILTQNTSWTNVERALVNLSAAGPLTAETLYALSSAKLRECLRPAGYFNVKARRLRAFLAVLIEQHDGQLDRLFAGDTPTVRARLLAIHGIGPETADSMLLYAGGHARFVVDAYTRRIFARHGWCEPDASYDELQALCEGALKRVGAEAQLDYWQDYHAQLVMVGKQLCRPRNPRCDACPLQILLPAGGLRPFPLAPPGR